LTLPEHLAEQNALRQCSLTNGVLHSGQGIVAPAAQSLRLGISPTCASHRFGGLPELPGAFNPNRNVHYEVRRA
jgi:hypothetical protein